MSPWSNSCSITYDSISPSLAGKTSFDGWYRESQTSYFDFTDLNLVSGYLAPYCEINTEGSRQSCTTQANICDKAGNCKASDLTSNFADIDLTNPVLTFDIWGRTLSGTSSDNLSGVEKVEVKLTKPGESEQTVVATGTSQWSYTITDAQLGHYKVAVVAYDRAFNASEIIEREYDINPSDPPSSPSTPAPSESPSTGTVYGVSTVSQNDGYFTEPEDVGDGEEESDSDYKPSSTPIGEVLGETDVERPKINWWWIVLAGLGAMTIGLVIRFSGRAKRK